MSSSIFNSSESPSCSSFDANTAYPSFIGALTSITHTNLRAEAEREYYRAPGRRCFVTPEDHARVSVARGLMTAAELNAWPALIRDVADSQAGDLEDPVDKVFRRKVDEYAARIEGRGGLRRARTT